LKTVDVVYRPILLVWANMLNSPVGKAIGWFANLGRPRGVGVGLVQEGIECYAFSYRLNE
jgi:hypothetical protein